MGGEAFDPDGEADDQITGEVEMQLTQITGGRGDADDPDRREGKIPKRRRGCRGRRPRSQAAVMGYVVQATARRGGRWDGWRSWREVGDGKGVEAGRDDRV